MHINNKKITKKSEKEIIYFLYQSKKNFVFRVLEKIYFVV